MSVMDTRTLYNIINASGVPMGTSPNGVAWTMRALHPAHEAGPFSGIPDRTCVPTALVEYKGNFSMQPPAGTGDTADYELAFIPSPLIFGVGRIYRTGATTFSQWLQNMQIPGADEAARLASYKSSVLAARLAYFGVTINVDVPALYNQGTLIAAQTAQSWQVTAVSPTVWTALYGGPPANYDNVIALPGSYQGLARDGAYLPMRLSSPSFPFVEQGTTYSYAGWLTGLPATSMPQLLPGSIGFVCIQNLSATAAVRVTIRMGVECQCSPQSSYSPFLHLPARPDEAAVTAYYGVSSGLQSAYPAAFNDWGALWKVIKDVAGTLWKPAKAVIDTAMPGGKLITGGVESIARLINRPRSQPRKQNGNGGGQPKQQNRSGAKKKKNGKGKKGGGK